MRDITIGKFSIGANHPPFVVAELSGNHNQSLEKALEIVEAAAKTGAHALKIQTYTPDTMTLDVKDGDFFISEPTSLWKGRSLYELYGEALTPWDWHGPIFERCKKLGLLAFSTPFDETAVDFLEKFDPPCHKIASFENTDLRLIRKAASTGRPLIISTGMASLADLEESVTVAREAGCKDLILLKCTSAYPANPEEIHLATIPHLREMFGCQVGLSDHTLGIGVSVASVALGATFIEKHFTLDRSQGGVDSAFSMEPAEMKMLVAESKKAWQAVGQVQYGRTASEQKSIQFRRSLYISRDVRKGEKLSSENVRVVRPGRGLPPKFYDLVLGKTVNRDLRKGTALSWDLIG